MNHSHWNTDDGEKGNKPSQSERPRRVFIRADLQRAVLNQTEHPDALMSTTVLHKYLEKQQMFYYVKLIDTNGVSIRILLL